MSRHVTYRGASIDMDAMRRENEKVTALGNMNVNARGDQLARGGSIAKTADQIARENHRVQSAIIQTGLKGPMPESPATVIKETIKPTTQKPVPKKQAKETELPNGDIQVDDAE